MFVLNTTIKKNNFNRKRIFNKKILTCNSIGVNVKVNILTEFITFESLTDVISTESNNTSLHNVYQQNL